MRTRPDKLRQLSLSEGTVETDEAGYLTDPAKWSVEFAEHAARIEGILLTPEHFEVIDFMRAYNDEHGVMADARFVLKFLAKRYQTDKAGSRREMFRLFPYGYVRQACKIAGMKQPRAWSTG